MKTLLLRLVLPLVSFLVLLISVLIIKTVSFTPGLVQKFEKPAPPVIKVDAIKAANILGESIRFRTISRQGQGDASGSEFLKLHAFLKKKFPLFHKNLKKEIVLDYSLLFTWPGSDPALKPVVLMAHMDVVPIDSSTRDKWEEAPFSGLVKNGFIWGRGTIDDKGTFIAQLLAIEELLKIGFRPRRTVYLAFGHDEEIESRGAKSIAALLEQRGVDAEFVLDEGGNVSVGIVPGVKPPVALIGITEKGYMTIELSAKGEGGHSSMPPKNTAVGIVSAAIQRLEANPLPARLEGAALLMLEHTGPYMPFVQKLGIANLWLLDGLVRAQLGAGRAGAATLRTTTAATMFSAGVKDNVLPTRAQATVNFRILPGDTIESVLAHVKETINDNRVMIKLDPASRNPSPVSDINSPGYKLLSEIIIPGSFPDSFASPYMVLGGTDAYYFTNISKNVFRFTPLKMNSADLKRFHGINERISVKAFENMVLFYAELLNKL